MAETNQSSITIGLEGGAMEGGGRKGGEGERERFLHVANLLDEPYFFPSPYSASL